MMNPNLGSIWTLTPKAQKRWTLTLTYTHKYPKHTQIEPWNTINLSYTQIRHKQQTKSMNYFKQRSTKIQTQNSSTQSKEKGDACNQPTKRWISPIEKVNLFDSSNFYLPSFWIPFRISLWLLLLFICVRFSGLWRRLSSSVLGVQCEMLTTSNRSF